MAKVNKVRKRKIKNRKKAARGKYDYGSGYNKNKLHYITEEELLKGLQDLGLTLVG